MIGYQLFVICYSLSVARCQLIVDHSALTTASNSLPRDVVDVVDFVDVVDKSALRNPQSALRNPKAQRPTGHAPSTERAPVPVPQGLGKRLGIHPHAERVASSARGDARDRQEGN